ncbi:MAG TPA: glycosyltransferase family 39 protein [Vicinamibacterales bacterium]|nr:glycosyltransferase family 39 protein [Vicinamibacterales bacterium]
MSDRSVTTERQFAIWMLLIAAIAVALRLIFPTADPPWQTTVGVVWHDEGAWVHNARNKALFGAWAQDAWNPMYIAPVFTGLEYVSFAVFGVGVWQARLVSELAGFASVLLIAFAVKRLAGRDAALIAAALVATNYVYVMWNRAALMEALMVAFIVASWYCYVRAQSAAAWGAAAAACALLAYFTKAAAVFFVAALGLEAIVALALASRAGDAAGRRAAMATLIGLIAVGLVALAVFIAPNWADYRFYNWQMSVTRKPSYDLRSLVDRVSWFPIVHDIFTRMWFTVVVSLLAVLGWLARFRTISAPERLLTGWVGLGALELLLHDTGNERRYIFFIPAMIAIAAIALGRDRRLLPAEVAAIPRTRLLVAMPVVLYALYIVLGAIARLTRLYVPGPGVRLGAVAALLVGAIVFATWPRAARVLSDGWSARAALLLAALVSAGQLAQFVQWAAARSYKNYEASRALAAILPPGTLVHGKLANGLSLENRIRPIFVGREFGNYADRKQRDDVRYILTYVAPRLGYEGSVILDVLDAYPNRTILKTFDVAETASGHDRAALLDKFGGKEAAGASPAGRGVNGPGTGARDQDITRAHD